MSAGKVAVGLLAGLAGGAILGLLFAPEKGEKTRRKIVSKGEDYADEVKDKVDEIVESLNEQVEVVKAKVKDAETKFQKKVAEVEKQMEAEAKAKV